MSKQVSVSEAELIRSEVALFQAMSQHSGLPPEVCREMFKEELGKLSSRNGEVAEETRFMQDLERIREANKSLPKRFDWKGLGLLFLAFVLAVICVWLGLNGGEW